MRLALGLALAIALIAASGCARAAEPMSMAAFRDAYVAEIRKEFPSVTVKVVSDDVVEVTAAPQRTATAYLDRAYALYRQHPSQLSAILKLFVGNVVAINGNPSFTAGQLRVLVRPASYLTPSGLGKQLLYRPLAGDLIALVAVDEPTKYIYPPADELRATLKMGDDALWARALENTDHKLPGVPSDAGEKAVAAFTTGEGLASSMLAEPRLWDTPALQSGGPIVVAPVNKDLVFLVRLGDAGRVAALRKAAAESAKDPDGLTTQVFVRRNGAWEVLPP